MVEYKRMPYRAGDHKAVCDYCGWVFYASQLRKDWRGLMACPKDYDPKHPQDDIRPVKETIAIAPGTGRPEPTDTFLADGDVTADDLTPAASRASAASINLVKDGALLQDPATSALWTEGDAWTWSSGVYTRVGGEGDAILGAELLTNGNFALNPATTGWSMSRSQWYGSPTKYCIWFSVSGGVGTLAFTNPGIVGGTTYRCVWTIIPAPDGYTWTPTTGARVELTGEYGDYYTTNGTKTDDIVAPATNAFRIYAADADARGPFVDNVSLKEITGYDPSTSEDAVTQDGSDMYDEPEEDEFYKLVFTMTATEGTLTPSLGGTDGTARTTSDTYTEYIQCGSTTDDLVFTGSATFSGTISNIQLYTTGLQECS